MSKGRFVRPEIVRLPLTGDDWIDVKGRLSYGEQRRLEGTALGDARQGTGDGTAIGIEFERFSIEYIATWIAAWSFTTDDGTPVRLSRDAIRNLDPDAADEIIEAIRNHVEVQEQAKKAVTGAT